MGSFVKAILDPQTFVARSGGEGEAVQEENQGKGEEEKESIPLFFKTRVKPFAYHKIQSSLQFMEGGSKAWRLYMIQDFSNFLPFCWSEKQISENLDHFNVLNMLKSFVNARTTYFNKGWRLKFLL